MQQAHINDPACGCETDNELCENTDNLEDDETVDIFSSDNDLDYVKLFFSRASSCFFQERHCKNIKKINLIKK